MAEQERAQRATQRMKEQMLQIETKYDAVAARFEHNVPPKHVHGGKMGNVDSCTESNSTLSPTIPTSTCDSRSAQDDVHRRECVSPSSKVNAGNLHRFQRQRLQSASIPSRRRSKTPDGRKSGSTSRSIHTTNAQTPNRKQKITLSVTC